jgi:hypothetical protein
MAASKRGIIFVSCGQLDPSEIRLGDEVCDLIREITPHDPYFAKQQTNLEDLTKNILGNLDRAVGLIAIMHPRGVVTYTDAKGTVHSHTRSSIWIEQEIAIATFITQIIKRPIEIAAFLHSDIQLEGMREKLLLNPQIFKTNSEVVEHLRPKLENWKTLAPSPSDSEVALVRVRVGIDHLSAQTILLEFKNDSDEELVIHEVMFFSGVYPLTRDPLTPQTGTEWTVTPKGKRPVNIPMGGNVLRNIFPLHKNDGVAFTADMDIVFRYEVRGRLKEERQAFRMEVNGLNNPVRIIAGSPL